MPIMIAEAAGAAANITTAVTTALEVCGTCINYCLENSVLCIGVGAGIATIAFGVFRKAKKAAK